MNHLVICDDNPTHLAYTKELVSQLMSDMPATCTCFPEATALLHAIKDAQIQPDVAILDIRMDGLDGISLAKQINRLTPGCKIIFLTNYLEYAPDVYDAEHVYFVLKSDMENRLAAALQKALAAPADISQLVVWQGKTVRRIALRDVLFLERTGRKTRILTEQEEHWAMQTPQEILDGPLANHFIRCHQSYWVHTAKILALKANDFYLPGDLRLPLSRTYRQAAREQFFASLNSPGASGRLSVHLPGTSG